MKIKSNNCRKLNVSKYLLIPSHSHYLRKRSEVTARAKTGGRLEFYITDKWNKGKEKRELHWKGDKDQSLEHTLSCRKTRPGSNPWRRLWAEVDSWTTPWATVETGQEPITGGFIIINYSWIRPYSKKGRWKWLHWGSWAWEEEGHQEPITGSKSLEAHAWWTRLAGAEVGLEWPLEEHLELQ